MTVEFKRATREVGLDEVVRLNDMFPDEFLPLTDRHLDRGLWWVMRDTSLQTHESVGFFGMVPFEPFPRVGYFKRGAVIPEYRGKGLQLKSMWFRLTEAREGTDWTHVVSECLVSNVASANNFIRSGFLMVEAERPWGEPGTIFWRRQVPR